jgi:hypothetical protein
LVGLRRRRCVTLKTEKRKKKSFAVAEMVGCGEEEFLRW